MDITEDFTNAQVVADPVTGVGKTINRLNGKPFARVIPIDALHSGVNGISGELPNGLEEGVSLERASDYRSADNFYSPGYQEPATNYTALQSAINPNNAIVSQPGANVKVNTFEEDPYYKQALRYASPDTTQEDYTPGYHDSVVLANASNKTLGTFPIFGSGWAVTMPSTIWDKKRKAVADYMLKMHDMSAANQSKLTYPTTEYFSGSPDWEGAVNRVAIRRYDDIQKSGDVSGIDKLGHQRHGEFSSVGADAKAFLSLAKEANEKANTAKTANISPSSVFGRDAQKAIADLGRLNSAPDAVKEQLVEDPATKERLHQINNTIGNTTSILGLSSQAIKDVQGKQEAWTKRTGRGSYDDYITETFESMIPIVKNVNGQYVTENIPYIHKLALDIAANKPEMFKDAELAQYKDPTATDINGNPILAKDGSQPSAQYTLADLENHIALTAGYKKTLNVHTVDNKSASGASGAQQAVDSTPQYISGIADKIKSGSIHRVADSKNYMIPGANAVTFVINGVMDVVPKSNKVEIAKKTLEMGANKEYGAIDVATAQSNILQNSEVWNDLSSKVEPKRPAETTGNFEQKVNGDTYQVTGSYGFPLNSSTFMNGVKSLSSGTDNDFYINASVMNPSGSKTDVSGVFIPAEFEKGKTAQSENWLSNFFSGGDKRVYNPVNGDGAFVGGTYFHKNKPDDSGVVTYTVYSKETKLPYRVRDEDGSLHEVTLPESYVMTTVNQPTNAIKQSNQKYTVDQDRETPIGITTTTQQNASTKKAGKQGVLVTESNQPPAEDVVKVSNRLMSSVANKTIIANQYYGGDVSKVTAADATKYASYMKSTPALKDAFNKLNK